MHRLMDRTQPSDLHPGSSQLHLIEVIAERQCAHSPEQGRAIHAAKTPAACFCHHFFYANHWGRSLQHFEDGSDQSNANLISRQAMVRSPARYFMLREIGVKCHDSRNANNTTRCYGELALSDRVAKQFRLGLMCGIVDRNDSHPRMSRNSLAGTIFGSLIAAEKIIMTPARRQTVNPKQHTP